MFLRKHRKADLNLKPLLPKDIDKLNAAYNETLTNVFTLEKIGNSVQGFVGLTQLTTSDGYHWYWGMVFVSFLHLTIIVFRQASGRAWQSAQRYNGGTCTCYGNVIHVAM